MHNKNSNNKKRIMYIKSNDYYYLSYNVILILYVMQCFNPKKFFQDYRKLFFISDFISDSKLLSILKKDTSSLNVSDKQLLSRVYSNGLTSRNQINQVLYLLERKDIVVLEKNDNWKTYDVSLNLENIDKTFFSRDVFMNEMKNIHEFKSYFHGLSSIKYETMLSKIFNENGVSVWHI